MLRCAEAIFKGFLALPKRVILALFVPFSMMCANKKILSQDVNRQPFNSLKNKKLKKLIESEWIRAKELDDKLQKLTAALSIAVTVGGLAGTTLVQTLSGSEMKYLVATIFLFSSMLLVVGVYIGFTGLMPKPRYGYGADFLNKVTKGGESARAEWLDAATSFQKDNLIRANQATAATMSVRNGVLIFVIALSISLLVTVVDGNNENKFDDAKVFLI